MSIFSGVSGIRLGGEVIGEEFCFCEVCMRKKVVFTFLKDVTGVVSVFIKEVFDL